MSKVQKFILLEIYKAGQVRKYEIEKAEFVLGRGPSSEVPIDEPGISREHVKIYIDRKSLYLVDLSSSNGTSVNQIKTLPNIPKEIQHFDVIRLGNTAVTIKLKYFEVTERLQKELSQIEGGKQFEEARTTLPSIPKLNQPLSSEQPHRPESRQQPSSSSLPHHPPIDMNKPVTPPDSINFKDAEVKFNLSPKDQAHEVIKEAEFLRHSIIKNAEIQKLKIIEETKRLAKLEVEKTFDEHQKNMDYLLEETKKEVSKLKYETENLLSDKKLQTNQEIDRSWKKHEEEIAAEKATYMEKLDRENKNKLEVLKEKLSFEAFSEKNKLITEAENEILSRHRYAQLEQEKERTEHLTKISDLVSQFENLKEELAKATNELVSERQKKADFDIQQQSERENFEKEKQGWISQLKDEEDKFNTEKQNLHKQLKDEEDRCHYEKLKLQEDLEMAKKDLEFEKKRLLSELSKIEEDLTIQKYRIESSVKDSLAELDREREKIAAVHVEHQKAIEQRDLVLEDIKKHHTEIERLNVLKENTNKSLVEINQKVGSFAEKKNQLQDQLTDLQKNFFEEKNKIKYDLDLEYQALKHTEEEKFKDFKSKQLKDLQKVREEHSKLMQNVSIEMAKEITHKLELQIAQSGSGRFNYDQSLELINSIIQVKSSSLTGAMPVQHIQIDEYRQRRKGEKFKSMMMGAALGIAALFAGNFIYQKITTDPMVAELAKQKEERQKREIANKYTPEKTNQFRDNYVELTLFTKDYVETYLNDDNQKEWVQFATKYFLKNWKVEEEKIIKVISSTRALVQSIEEKKDDLKKNTLKKELEKLREIEKETAKTHADLLGSFVRLEAYKKQEKEFFLKKMGYRLPAGK